MANPDVFDGLHELHDDEIHVDELLRNWCAWLRGGRRGGGGDAAPMFRMYRSPARVRDHYGMSTRSAVIEAEALRVERTVAGLPTAHAAVLRWYYVRNSSPWRAAREIGCAAGELVDLLRQARRQLTAQLHPARPVQQGIRVLRQQVHTALGAVTA